MFLTIETLGIHNIHNESVQIKCIFIHSYIFSNCIILTYPAVIVYIIIDRMLLVGSYIKNLLLWRSLLPALPSAVWCKYKKGSLHSLLHRGGVVVRLDLSPSSIFYELKKSKQHLSGFWCQFWETQIMDNKLHIVGKSGTKSKPGF